MTVRIVQITDLHLFADSQTELKGICTRETLKSVLSAIRSDCGEFDRLIVTGDLAHDEKQETYFALRESLGDWLPRLRIVPGNHDNRDHMRSAFGVRIETLEDRNVFVDTIGGWKLVGLDSQIPGELSGRLGNQQLDWLEHEMQLSNGPIALFMHHPPVATESSWLDQIGLRDAEELKSLLRRIDRVRLICCGHIHQELSSSIGNTLVVTTPSTGVQFRPESSQLIVDNVAHGYRLIELQPDGQFQTHVQRVQQVPNKTR